MKNGWITDSNGTKRHYVDDKYHNDNGPAIIWEDGTKYWAKHGNKHREDGPAIEWSDGEKEWWYEGKRLGHALDGYTQEKFEQWLKFRAFL